jgi:hypothetical protein
MERTYKYTDSPSIVLDAEDKPIDLTTYKGLRASISVDTLAFDVEIKDARIRFGRLDFLVSPNSGIGVKWVEQHKVSIKS